MNDPVKHPSHYCDGGIETIDFIRAKLSTTEFVGYCKGNALKYISRAGKKGDEADRPRGEWIHTPNGIDRDFVWWTCSECGHKIFSETEKDRREFHAYCGECGADMRGDTE